MRIIALLVLLMAGCSSFESEVRSTGVFYDENKAPSEPAWKDLKAEDKLRIISMLKAARKQ